MLLKMLNETTKNAACFMVASSSVNSLNSLRIKLLVKFNATRTIIKSNIFIILTRKSS